MTRHTSPAQCHRTHCLRHAFVMCLLGVHFAPTAHAQDSTASETTPWMHGPSVGLLTEGRDRIPTVGLHYTEIRPGKIGLDFSFGTCPLTLALGALSVASRGGLTVPIELRRGLLLLPSAGASLVGIAGLGGGGATFGYNVGGAALLGAGTKRFRTGLTWHRMRDVNRDYWLLELGFVNFPDTRVTPSAAPPF